MLSVGCSIYENGRSLLWVWREEGAFFQPDSQSAAPRPHPTLTPSRRSVWPWPVFRLKRPKFRLVVGSPHFHTDPPSRGDKNTEIPPWSCPLGALYTGMADPSSGCGGKKGPFFPPESQTAPAPPPPPHPHALTSLGLALACISIEKAQISLLISFCKKKNRKFRIVLNAFRKFLSVCAVVSITNQVLL